MMMKAARLTVVLSKLITAPTNCDTKAYSCQLADQSADE